jgi:hypothetical protein
MRWRLLPCPCSRCALRGAAAGSEAYAPDEIAALSSMSQGVGSALDVLAVSDEISHGSIADAVRTELAPLREQLDAIATALRAGPP